MTPKKDKELVYQMINQMEKRKKRNWWITLVIGIVVGAAVLLTMWSADTSIDRTTKRYQVVKNANDELMESNNTLQAEYAKSITTLESIKEENQNLNALISGGQAQVREVNEKLRALNDENISLQNSMAAINRELVSLQRIISDNRSAIESNVSRKLMTQVETMQREVRIDRRFEADWRRLNQPLNNLNNNNRQ